jgi:hypothetical protein
MVCNLQPVEFRWLLRRSERRTELTWCCCVAVFGRIDSQLGEWIMNETEAMVPTSMKRDLMPKKVMGRSFREYMHGRLST